MRVRAFAKINLSLRVLDTRPDGNHSLRTTFQAIALHDTLTIRRRRGPFRLTCDDPRLPVDATNLIVRAARAVWTAAGRRGLPRDVAVHVEKRIPLEAGLGGGSSDAAAALRVLGRMWRVDEARLRTIGSILGADVPYYFEGGTAEGTGRGDELVRLRDRKAAWVVLALPDFGVSTREAYAWWDQDHGSRRSSFDKLRMSGAPDRRNDLQRPVAKRHPEISRLVSALRRAGASYAAMSGSGSACFGLFASRRAADTAAGKVSARFGFRTVVTRTLSRAACRRLAAG